MKRRCIILFLFLALTELPHKKVADIEGNKVYIDSICDADVNIIVFWATWCKGCKKEMDFIKENLKDTIHVKVISVSQDTRKNRAKMMNVINTKKWKFYHLWDPDMKLGQALGVYALPTTIVVDKDGKVIMFKTGFGKKDKDKLLKFLNMNDGENNEKD